MAELQMVQGHLADMALDIDAAALLVSRAAWTKAQTAFAGHGSELAPIKAAAQKAGVSG